MAGRDWFDKMQSQVWSLKDKNSSKGLAENVIGKQLQ